MRVFVTGGTGAIGRPAVRSLVAAGHDVSGLARSSGSAAWLDDHGATPVQVSLFDVAGLTRAVTGHDAVVNLATAMAATHLFVFRRAWRATERVRTDPPWVARTWARLCS